MDRPLDPLPAPRPCKAPPPEYVPATSPTTGDGSGTLADHWAAIESTPGFQGGFIRASCDHGILQRVSDGRPAGRTGAGLHDNGVAAPGHRWAYGGDFGGTVHGGACVADEAVLPDRSPTPAPYEDREIAAPVRIRCYRHEGIVLANHQHFRGLTWLAAAWELSLADGRTLTGPAELPDLRPGETAAVPLPFALPADGGEAWLTLRVTTAEDEPWAPRGTEVCAPRVRLRAAALVEPGSAVSGPPVAVDDDGLLVHPLLTAAPVLSLRRAPAEDDERGGVARRRRTWGPDALVRKVVSVRRVGEAVTVLAEYAGTAGVVRHRQEFRPVEGGVRVAESAELPAEFADVARVGSVFETVPGLDLLEWFGREPGESRPDRSAGAPAGRHTPPVDALVTPRPRPQESGGRHGVRRFTLSAADATGLAVELDEPRQVSVTLTRPPLRTEDPTAAAHHDEPVPGPGCVVHLDAAHRGLGTASCGPGTSPAPAPLVRAGVHRWSWTLRVL